MPARTPRSPTTAPPRPARPSRGWPPAALLAPRVGRPRVRGRRSAVGRRPSVVGRSRAAAPAALLAIAVAAGVLVATVVDDAATRQAAWGETRLVPIASRELEPGSRVEAGAFTWARRPAIVVPDAADGSDPTGRLATDRILQGEIIPSRRLAPAGAQGLTALVPAGHHALAVPSDARTPPLDAGQAVDLYAAPDLAPFDGTGGGGGVGRDERTTPRRLAEGARVLRVGERQITVAVADAEAAAVASALVSGTVIVALAPP